MIGIVSTGFGNVNAIRIIYSELGVESLIIDNLNELKKIKKLIIPGIGNFDSTINNLKNKNLFTHIDELVQKKGMPILGICIGMHLFYLDSEEGECKGFGWLSDKIIKLRVNKLRIPHMGWNQVKFTANNPLFKGIENNSYFYFLHSYGNIKNIKNHSMIAYTDYGEPIVSAINNENIFGVQFHPEKSHTNGIKILNNFSNFNA
tara:strand:- start:1310 stop:1921 length:612 start_codon:yes stop_codon:yes gene_type:complete